MNHYGPGRSLVFGLALVMLASSCGDAGSTTPSAAPVVELRTDGVGPVDLGQPPAAVFAELNSFFGEPDVDTGWIPPDSPLYGSCPGEAMWAAGWGSFYAFFISDAPITAENADSAGRLYSFSYGYDFSRNEGATDPRSLALATEDGVGLGATRQALDEQYGQALEVEYNQSSDTWRWTVALDGAQLQGLLSGPEPQDTVVLVESSPSCEIQ